MPPSVSVITSVYNNGPYIGAAVESILRQTLTDFEYIIVDDASTDETPEVIAYYESRDDRITFLQNKENLGPSSGLNIAIERAQSDYVAILDGDDLSLPSRLEDQVMFMDNNPQVGLAGSACYYMDQDGNYLFNSGAVKFTSAMVIWRSFFTYPFLHSSTIYRRELLEKVGGYDPENFYAIDYVVFLKLFDITKFARMPQFLAAYRLGDHRLSHKYKNEQTNQGIKIRQALYRKLLGKNIPAETVKIFRNDFVNRSQDNLESAQKVEKLLLELCEGLQNKYTLSSYEKKYIKLDCANKLYALARKNRRWSRPYFFRVTARAHRYDPLILLRAENRKYIRNIRQF